MDGTFLIGELPYGPASVVGLAKDHGREFMLVFIEPDMPELEILLPIGACIKGILYDDEGLVSDAYVAVRYIERANQILRRRYLELLDRAAEERFRGTGPSEGQWEGGKPHTDAGSENFWPIGTFDLCDVDPDRPFQLVLLNRDRPSLYRPEHVFEEIIMLAPGEHSDKLLKIERKH